MLSETQKKGEIAFLQIALRAVQKGMVLSKPTTDTRYDAILDDGMKLYRVQVKYADGSCSTSDGAVRVELRRKTNSVSAKPRTYNSEEIDLLLIYIPKTGDIIKLLPLQFEDKPAIQLRLEPPKNGQMKGVVLAEDFRW